MNRKQQKHETFLFIVSLGACVLMAQILPLLARTIPPGQVRVSTPVYAPANSFNPLLGSYAYSVSWNGIPAGGIELVLDRKNDDYEIRTSAWTAKGIDIVYKLRYESEAVLAADTLRPKHSFSTVRTNSKEKITELEFLPDGKILSTRTNDRGRVKTLRFDPDNFTLEPYSAGFLALSQDWKVGEIRRFDMFSGKSRYLISLAAVELTDLLVNEKMRPAIVLIPTVEKLTDTENEADDKKLRKARIFISADQPREILKISSDLLFGTVNTEMVGFIPKTTPPPPDTTNKDRMAAIGL